MVSSCAGGGLYLIYRECFFTERAVRIGRCCWGSDGINAPQSVQKWVDVVLRIMCNGEPGSDRLMAGVNDATGLF